MCRISIWALHCLSSISVGSNLHNTRTWSLPQSTNRDVLQCKTEFINLLLIISQFDFFSSWVSLCLFYISWVFLKPAIGYCLIIRRAPIDLFFRCDHYEFFVEFANFFPIFPFVYFGIQISHDECNFLRNALRLGVVQHTVKLVQFQIRIISDIWEYPWTHFFESWSNISLLEYQPIFVTEEISIFRPVLYTWKIKNSCYILSNWLHWFRVLIFHAAKIIFVWCEQLHNYVPLTPKAHFFSWAEDQFQGIWHHLWCFS